MDAALLLALSLFCLRLLGGLESARDLTLWDEADYLRRALALPERGLPAPEWGPLHSLLYFGLSRFVTDGVVLHDSVYRLLVLLPALALYLCARGAGAPRVLCLLGPVLFAVSAAAHVAPRPTLLALALVLCGLALGLGRSSLAGALAPLGLSLLLASFARPELFLSFLLVSALLALALLLRVRAGEKRPALRAGLTYGALALLCMALLGNPFSDDTGRRLYAFCQHYALGEVQRAGLGASPWNQCNDVLRRSFGEVHSVGEAARRNPDAFLTHLRDNLHLYPEASLQLFLRGPSHASVLAPRPLPWTPLREAHALLLALGTAAFLGALMLHARGLDAALRAPGTVLCALALGAVLLPSVLSSLLLHPREHYLVLQGVLLPLFALAWVGAAAHGPESRMLQGAAVGIALALVIAAPRLGPLPTHETPLHRRVVAQLRPLLPASRPVALLEAQGGYDVYLGRHVTRVAPSHKREAESFERFLQRRGVGAVLLEPQLARDARLVHDAGFRAFASRPEDFGYRAVALDGTGMVLAVRVGVPPVRSTPSARSAAPQERVARPRTGERGPQ